MTKKKKIRGQAETVSADAVISDDYLWIYGEWLAVRSVSRLIRHPFQFVEFRFHEFKEPIRVPSGWKVERKVS